METVRSMLRHKGSEIFWVAPEATGYEAVAMMADKSVGALLVLSGGKLTGIVSERDYARKVILKGKHSHEMQVKEIMTSPVFTVSPGHSVEDCMRVITAHRIRHLPVMQSPLLGLLRDFHGLGCRVGRNCAWISEWPPGRIEEISTSKAIFVCFLWGGFSD